MDIPLNAAMKRFVSQQVKSGEFSTPQDVVRAGLAKLMHNSVLERMSRQELEALFPGLRKDIQAGLAQADAGRVSDGESFFNELEQDHGVPSKRRRGSR